jgi:hypothetical protein
MMSDTLTNIDESRLSKPGSKSGELQRAILKILREHEQQLVANVSEHRAREIIKGITTAPKSKWQPAG